MLNDTKQVRLYANRNPSSLQACIIFDGRIVSCFKIKRDERVTFRYLFIQHFCFYFQSPGRDSPGDDSSASIVTVESTSSGGCRNSTTSLDSGRASNSNSNSTATDSSFHSIHPIREHPYPVRGNSLGLPPPPVSHMGRMSSIGSVGSSSFRQSYHSSSSSLGSVERAEDSICALDIQEMTADGVPVRKSLTSGFKVPFNHSKVFLRAHTDQPT